MAQGEDGAERSRRERPPCSIIVPVFNRASLTRQCLDRLLQGPRPEVEYELVVVDDGSTDRTPRLLEQYASLVRVVRHDDNRGFTRAANSGAAAASGDYLVFLNNDTLPEPGWLDALVRYAEEHPAAAVVGSKLLYPNETIQHAGVTITVEGLPRHIYRGFPGDLPLTNKSRRFQAVTAACALVRRDAFRRAGGFDENFTNGYEDIDLCLRLIELGHEVHYCHESVVIHLENATRGFEPASAGHELFVKRWPNLVPDDLQYYIADGLLTVVYRETFPIELHVSPLLASVVSDDREADRLLQIRSRQVFELMQENTRLRVTSDGDGYEPRTAPAQEPDPHARRAVLFAAGGTADTSRYRCDHQAEQLGVLGVTSHVAPAFSLEPALLDRYEVFILHRVPYLPDIESFVRKAKARGKLVVFDADELVFEPRALPHLAAASEVREPERIARREEVARYRDAMRACDAVLVATEPLREAASELNPRVLVVPNAVSREMVELADAALGGETRGEAFARPTLAYLSGTRTHDRDFLEAADALLACLDRYPTLRLLLIGPLTLDERFHHFRDRVDRLPIQRWQRLPELLRRVDVSIAPLERNNPFAESRSCAKYLEAALVGVPTVASARGEFAQVIEHGLTGLLADSPHEWEAALGSLLDSNELREQIGRAARAAVLARHTTFAAAPRLVDALRELTSDQLADRPLAINWIVTAPPVEPTSHERTTFELASRLARNGHLVRMYVAPGPQLEGRADDELESFLAGRYPVQELDLHIDRSPAEHPDFLPAEVSIAASAAAAAAVAGHERSLLKCQLVQKLEPGESYQRPLRYICLGAGMAERIRALTGKPADAIDPDVEEAAADLERILRDACFARLPVRTILEPIEAPA